MIKLKNDQQAFSLVEILVYIFITAMLLVSISSLLLANFNIRKQLKTSDLVYNNARFIINKLNNEIHNVTVFDDLRPNSEQILFYPNTGNSFAFEVENNNLIYKEIEEAGGESSLEYILNSEQVEVQEIIFTPIDDWQTNENKGVFINFTLSTGHPDDVYKYLSENFQTFIAIR